MARIVALALVYAALALPALRWSAVNGGIGLAVWPAAGVGLAALVLGGARLWPGIFLGYCLAALLQPTPHPSWLPALVAAGNTLGLVAAVRLLRWRRFDGGVDAPRDFVSLLMATLLAAALSAGIGTSALALALASPARLPTLGSDWSLWLLRDLAGMQIIGVAILAWVHGRAPRSPAWWLQFAGCIAVTVLVGWLVFLRPGERLYTFLAFCPLIWAALALRLRGTTLMCLLVAAFAIYGTALGNGPFAAADLRQRFIDLQVFIVVAAVAMLMLAVVADERRAQKALSLSEARLRVALEATGTGLWKLDLRTDDMDFSPECSRVAGIDAHGVDATRAGVLRFVHAEDQPALRAAFRDAVAQRALFESAFRLVRDDGSQAWLEARGRVVVDDAGRPTAVLGTLTDVTERQRDAHRLEEQARLLDLAADPILVRGMDGRIRYWNRGAAALYGHSAEEALGRDARELLCGGPPGPDEHIEKKLLADGRWEGELPHRHRDGTPLLVHARWVLDRDANGQPRSVLQTHTDVTGRRRAEANARFLAGLDRHIAQSVGADEVADTGLRLLGEHLGLLRCTLSDIDVEHGRIRTLHEWTRGVSRPRETLDARDFFVTEFGRRLADGEAVAVGDLHADPLTAAFAQNYAPYGTAAIAAASYVIEGRLAGTLTASSAEVRHWREDEVHLLREVVARLWPAIERAKSLAALRESEARFRQVADTAPMMIWVTEADGACSYVSRRWTEFTGRMHEAELGFGWMDVLHADDRDATMAAFANAIERQEPFTAEYRALRWDGRHRWLHASARPRFGAGSEFLGFIGAAMDVTERREAEEALREADRRKDEFLATLAHELRNPLSPIRTGLQVLNLTTDAGIARRTREMMDRQLGHMVRLIDDLLDVSRITSGKVVLQRSRISLQDAARAAVESSRPSIEAAGHRLHLDLPADPLWVDADATRLAQVLGNLLANAAKYTPDGGDIHLRVHACDGEACIDVRDTGLGIPPEALGEVFGMFAQVNRTLDRAQGGLGIGLALSRRLIEMHGGSITAESEGLGRGSTFTVRLPLAADEAVGDAAGAEMRARDVPACRVLVVDDNADAAESLAMMLQLQGHATRVAYSGTEGLLVACEFLPQVAFLDIGMPGMNGYELARRLRRESELDGLHLVAVSGWGGRADRQQALDAGFDLHLTKPVSAEAVSRVVADACLREADVG